MDASTPAFATAATAFLLLVTTGRRVDLVRLELETHLHAACFPPPSYVYEVTALPVATVEAGGGCGRVSAPALLRVSVVCPAATVIALAAVFSRCALVRSVYDGINVRSAAGIVAALALLPLPPADVRIVGRRRRLQSSNTNIDNSTDSSVYHVVSDFRGLALGDEPTATCYVARFLGDGGDATVRGLGAASSTSGSNGGSDTADATTQMDVVRCYLTCCLAQVSRRSAWRCVPYVGGPSHPGTPTLPHPASPNWASRRCGRAPWYSTPSPAGAPPPNRPLSSPYLARI